MRMNRGTIILIVALVVVAVVLLILNNNQAAAPGEDTPMPTTAPVVLLPGIDQNTLARLEVRDNTTGARVVLSKADVNSPWIYDSNSPGLAQNLGGTAPISAEPATSSTGIADSTQMSSLVGVLSALQSSDSFTDTNLDGFGLRTPRYSVFITAYDGTAFVLHIGAQSRVNPRYYVTMGEAGSATESVAAATAEATLEVTPESTMLAATAEVTAEATGEATPEFTPEPTIPVNPPLPPLAAPLVTLEGSYTIYVAQKTSLDRLIALITAPPFATPTPQPTFDLLSAMGTPEATAEAVVEPTAEATPDATAEATAAP